MDRTEKFLFWESLLFGLFLGAMAGWAWADGEHLAAAFVSVPALISLGVAVWIARDHV